MLMLYIVAILVITKCITADTPANCSYEEIQGKWLFYLGKSGYTNQIDCNEIVHPTNKMLVQLFFPDLAVDMNGNLGKWTMIYNQGFEVRLMGRSYFAFSKYQKHGNTSVSICNETFNGWAHDEVSVTKPEFPPKNWGCYYGRRISGTHSPKPEVIRPHLDTHALNQDYHSNKHFIDEINNVQTSWTAVIYEEYKNFKIRDMIQRSGGMASLKRKVPLPKSSIPTAEQIQLAKLAPKSFDWRNVNGTNYVSPVRNQGNCGSCYAFSSMGMLEARIRVITNNKQKPVLSTQNIVGCSNYSQKCEGGFPYLVAGKYTEDFGSIAEECYPYKGVDTKCEPLKPDCPRQYGSNFYYIGGFYGACNEALMKVELVKNGPLSISFEVYNDFVHYKGGIYHHTGLEDKFNPFEITNHAVLLVGYGEDEITKEKYWIVKNSWGTAWGEDGYFRIRRGVNECAIESIAVATTPHIL